MMYRKKVSAFFNGTPDTTATHNADDVYNLNIATFLQEYLEDETDYYPLGTGIIPESLFRQQSDHEGKRELQTYKI